MDVPLGLSATTKDMVTHESLATKDSALEMRFPKGFPAVADEDMCDWMKQWYLQVKRPTDVTCVAVKLEAVGLDRSSKIAFQFNIV